MYFEGCACLVVSYALYYWYVGEMHGVQNPDTPAKIWRVDMYDKSQEVAICNLNINLLINDYNYTHLISLISITNDYNKVLTGQRAASQCKIQKN